MTLEELKEKIKFTDRELDLTDNCKVYANNNPAGMPGHNLAILVAKLSQQSDFLMAYIAMLTMSIASKEEEEDGA
jgi:hypothetical protein